MHLLVIPHFSRHNKVLPSPVSTTHSNASDFTSDESDSDSNLSLPSDMTPPTGLSQFQSEPVSLASLRSPSPGCSADCFGNNCGARCARRISMFQERFDLFQGYQRLPYSQAIDGPPMGMRRSYTVGPGHEQVNFRKDASARKVSFALKSIFRSRRT
ncbi:hypothetical protein INT43_008445 [Umbelopsis isabellina]|uniref:Uncharacterized protein n=1 Tax=Mortierella isabellina TaxID=91625 RepID=A0A8H7PVI7_MORIS|nr:hypothetical protein INT43_008445 [Umbelopsis isabellina]